MRKVESVLTHSKLTQYGAKSTKQKINGLSKCRLVTNCRTFTTILLFQYLSALGDYLIFVQLTVVWL